MISLKCANLLWKSAHRVSLCYTVFTNSLFLRGLFNAIALSIVKLQYATRGIQKNVKMHRVVWELSMLNSFSQTEVLKRGYALWTCITTPWSWMRERPTRPWKLFSLFTVFTVHSVHHEYYYMHLLYIPTPTTRQKRLERTTERQRQKWISNASILCSNC